MNLTWSGETCKRGNTSSTITLLRENYHLILVHSGFFLNENSNKVWWYTPIITTVRRLKQEDCEFEASLGYRVRSCLKK
jgi:hypothetical protein